MKKRIGALCLFWVLGLSSCAMFGPWQRGQASFERGLALFNQGYFEEAIPYFQRATDEDPNFAEAYFYLGRSQLSLRRWREAIQPLRTAHRLAPAEMKQEVYNLLLDAFLAAAVGGLGPERPRSSVDPLRDPY